MRNARLKFNKVTLLDDKKAIDLFNTRPSQLGNKEICILSHDEQLTACWIYDNTVIRRSIPESDVSYIKDLFFTKKLFSKKKKKKNILTDYQSIQMITSRYGCGKKLSVALAQLEDYFPFEEKEQTDQEKKLEG